MRMGKAERKEDERMKTKGMAGIWARRAFPSSCKLPTVLLSHPSAELRAQKSRAAVGSQLVLFRSNPQREPASLLTRGLYFRYPSMKDTSSSLENTNPPWCTSHDAPLRRKFDESAVFADDMTREILLAHYNGRTSMYAK